MPQLLFIETSALECSVALSRDKEIILCKENAIQNSHSALLSVFIQEIITESGIKYQDLDAVVVSKGPGSYTGLRIGVSTAKGICYAAEVPLIAIDTTLALANAAVKQLPSENALYCPLIDARRMEVYTAFYNYKLETIREVKAELLEENPFDEILKSQIVYFFGDGMSKSKEILQHQPNAHFLEIKNSARHLLEPAFVAFEKKQFEDVAYFEPFYLKDFVAGKPKVKGLYE